MLRRRLFGAGWAIVVVVAAILGRRGARRGGAVEAFVSVTTTVIGAPRRRLKISCLASLQQPFPTQHLSRNRRHLPSCSFTTAARRRRSYAQLLLLSATTTTSDTNDSGASDPQQPADSTSSSSSSIADWVVEGLEDASRGDRITSRSTVQAGENDTLPAEGLPIGSVRILASESTYEPDPDDHLMPIRLLVGRNGWGTGIHPTTRLCLEWMCRGDVICGGETVLDYGCGSGVLSIAALHMGAARCVGVDVEAEALVTAERNVALNDYDASARFEPLHTRQVLPFGILPPADVCVANILVGQLVRPSMVAAIVTNLAPGGLLCLSGIRPGDQVQSLKAAYGDHVEWLDDEHYAELAAAETPGSLASYGFDCGVWCRVVGRKKASARDEDVAAMSESAVS